MKTADAIKVIIEFKGVNLKANLTELKFSLLNQGKSNVPDLSNIYKAALEVKKVSAQIDEIVHATGIIQCLPHILEKDEIVKDLSLASGADGEGIDLITNKRIAEFKFARWQSDKANGMRKRQVFADLVNLYLHPTTVKKELYVYNAPKIIKYFQSKKSKWSNVLNKSGGLENKLEEHLNKNGINGQFLNDIYSVSGVTVLDIDDILQ